jgi:hypothetical protein
VQKRKRAWRVAALSQIVYMRLRHNRALVLLPRAEMSAASDGEPESVEMIENHYSSPLPSRHQLPHARPRDPRRRPGVEAGPPGSVRWCSYVIF